MKNKILPVVLALLMLAFSAEAARAEEGQSKPAVSPQAQDLSDHPSHTCRKEELPAWPLYPLNKTEREARLRLFLNNQRFVLSKDTRDTERQTCETILESLKSSKAVTVLASDIHARGRNDEYVVQNTIKKLNQTVLSNCPSLLDDIHRAYVADGKYADSPAFLAKSKEEKEAEASFYEANANIEFYDLSPYLGADTWGYFGEGVVLHPSQKVLERWSKERQEKAKEQFPKLTPPFDKPARLRYIYSTMFKIFNVETCRAVPQDPFLSVGRLSTT